MTASKVLVIDDDPGMFTLVSDLVANEHTQVLWAKSLIEGLQLASHHRIDAVLLDHSLPDGEGVERIPELVSQDRLRPILFITGQAGSETAIEAIKRGAFEYLSKPVGFALLRQKIHEAIEYRALTRMPVLVEKVGNGPDRDILIGRSRCMQEIYKSIGRIAALETPVLVEGENGTGKEMISRTIHQHGPRNRGPFVKVNCRDFEDGPLQHELFGPNGVIRETHGGTVLIEGLDRIGTAMQTRLLRFFQNPLFEAPHVQTRIILSSCIPSSELLQSGALQSDLYYALLPYRICVPALRDREEDFDLLVSHFIQRFASVASPHPNGLPPRISSSAMQILKSYRWPGNVSELRSVLQNALMESSGAILANEALQRSISQSTVQHPSLSAALVTEPNDEPAMKDLNQIASMGIPWDVETFVRHLISSSPHEIYEKSIRELDRRILKVVLDYTQGNRVHAARLLGMTRTSLRRKMNALVDSDIQQASE